VTPVRRWGRSALLAVLVVLAGVAGTASAAAPGPLRIDAAGCGSPPPELPAGPVAFTLVNADRAFAAVYLVDPAGLVYAEVPSITPGRSRPLTGTLAAGRYALRCVFTDGTVRTSAPITLTGPSSGAVPGYRPMPDLAMAGPVAAYRGWVRAALPGLAAGCARLDADVAAGDLAAARTDWLTAHLDYERLGAAYTSFGDFDAAIDGRADGLPLGTADPGWTGLHAIEHGLWHGASAARLRPLTTGLVASVAGLIADFPSEEVDPGDLPLRAHEILENTLQFQLTGAADYGSGSTLATAYANTQGTREVLSVLAPLLTPRDPGLAAALDRGIARVQADLLATRGSGGDWTPVAAVPAAARQRLDGDLGALLERLAAVPNLLAPRNSG
jgi:iron uptake system EfeUOB component EfeO/EfeM